MNRRKQITYLILLSLSFLILFRPATGTETRLSNAPTGHEIFPFQSMPPSPPLDNHTSFLPPPKYEYNENGSEEGLNYSDQTILPEPTLSSRMRTIPMPVQGEEEPEETDSLQETPARMVPIEGTASQAKAIEPAEAIDKPGNLSSDIDRKILTSTDGTIAESALILEQANGKTYAYTRGQSVEIKVDPRNAINSVKAAIGAGEIRLIKLTANDNNIAIYSITTEVDIKLLGILPAKMQVNANIDANTGRLVALYEPWWSFAASRNSYKIMTAGAIYWAQYPGS
jgi:hypothetical protein